MVVQYQMDDGNHKSGLLQLHVVFKVVTCVKSLSKGISANAPKNDACSGEIDHAVVSAILVKAVEGVDILSSSITSTSSFIVMIGCPDAAGGFCGCPFSSEMGN